MSNLFAGPHLWILLIVILLLFGAAKLPALAKSMGQSARIFRGEMKAMKTDDATVASAAADAPVAEPTASAPADPTAGAGGVDTPKP
ncbi:MAG: twin-arginine translocase TatA/TatE family subunit [Candidatus Microbacterium phytovorans]|uniref:Sec-independent protein translocase protein TatA n=1 Tax=Candidatus Microbacterium phytovorans TaxID=3121374 RepID=A0AAJ6B5X6_9MICO|nr:twin-arginine translocase TatA/TatE family subunit [Microbacterium sp.]WEK14271.1 MAG: twin-arginine translocase TatA/TatE family subunit [Microbacterium sp.]